MEKLDIENKSSDTLLLGARWLMLNSVIAPSGWDIIKWNKLAKKSQKERLVIAGKLIDVVIDRLQDSE